MKSNQCLDNLLKSVLNGCSEKEVRQLINGFILQLKQEIIEEQKENEETVEVTIGAIFDAGIEDEIGLNPWCINEGLVDKEDTHSVPIRLAIRHGLLGR